MTPDEKRKLMTPSGRPPVMFGQYRPTSPVCDLVPVSPPWPPPPWSMMDTTPTAASSDGSPSARQPTQNTGATSELMTVGVPKLDSPVVLPTNQFAIPWQQIIVNFWRLAQPTGVVPGTYNTVTVNANGQVTSAVNSGVQADAPHDNNVYGRQNGAWVIVTSTGT